MNFPRFTGHQVKSYNKIKGGSEGMEGNRRNYSEEFKKEAVGHSLTSEKTVIEVAQDLGVIWIDGVPNIGKTENWPSPEMVSKGSPRKKKRSEGLKKELYDVKRCEIY